MRRHAFLLRHSTEESQRLTGKGEEMGIVVSLAIVAGMLHVIFRLRGGA